MIIQVYNTTNRTTEYVLTPYNPKAEKLLNLITNFFSDRDKLKQYISNHLFEIYKDSFAELVNTNMMRFKILNLEHQQDCFYLFKLHKDKNNILSLLDSYDILIFDGHVSLGENIESILKILKIDPLLRLRLKLFKLRRMRQGLKDFDILPPFDGDRDYIENVIKWKIHDCVSELYKFKGIDKLIDNSFDTYFPKDDQGYYYEECEDEYFYHTHIYSQNIQKASINEINKQIAYLKKEMDGGDYYETYPKKIENNYLRLQKQLAKLTENEL